MRRSVGLWLCVVFIMALLCEWAIALGGGSCGDCRNEWVRTLEDVSGCAGNCLDGSCLNYYSLNSVCDTTVNAGECKGTYTDTAPAVEYKSTCFPSQGIGCKCHDGGIRTGNIVFHQVKYCIPCN